MVDTPQEIAVSQAAREAAADFSDAEARLWSMGDESAHSGPMRRGERDDSLTVQAFAAFEHRIASTRTPPGTEREAVLETKLAEAVRALDQLERCMMLIPERTRPDTSNARALIAHLYALPPQTEPDTSPTIGEEGAAVTGLDDRNGDREPQSRSSMAVTRSSQPRTDCAAPSPPAPIAPGIEREDETESEREKWERSFKPGNDPTLSYCHGYEDGRDGKTPRGSSPEYEDGYYAAHCALTPPTEPVVDDGEEGP